MWPNFVVVSAPSLAFSHRVVEAHEPVLVQALRPELAVEAFDERVVGRLARPAEVERHVSCIGPQIEIARNELAALVDPDRCRLANLAAHPLEHLDHIRRPEPEPRHDRRREPAERIDDTQDAQLRSGCQLVMDQVHGPYLIRTGCRAAAITKLRFHPPLGRFPTQLQAQLLVCKADKHACRSHPSPLAGATHESSPYEMNCSGSLATLALARRCERQL